MPLWAMEEEVKVSVQMILKHILRTIKESQTKVCSNKALKKGIRMRIVLCVVVVVGLGLRLGWGLEIIKYALGKNLIVKKLFATTRRKTFVSIDSCICLQWIFFKVLKEYIC